MEWAKSYAERFLVGCCNSPILVADDDEVNRALVELCLNDLGFQNILTVKNGKEALGAFHEQKDEIILVVSDFHMPLMKGDELFWRLKQNGGIIRFLLCSGYMTIPSVKRLLKAGMNGYLQKPFTHSEFLLAVINALI